MMISTASEVRGAGLIVVFVILIFSSATASSEQKQDTITTFSGNGGGGDGGVILQIHEKMAEQAWIHCRKELIDKQDFDSNSYLPMMNSRHRSVEGQPLYDCLKSRNLLVKRSRQEGKSWFTKLVELVSGRPNSPRRELISKSRPILAPTSAPSPNAPLPSSTEAPSPSPENAPSISPENAPSSPENAPSASVSAPIIPPSPDLQPPVPLPPSYSINDVPAPPPKHHQPLPQAIPPSKKQKVKNRAAIAATTGGAVIVMSLILCCFIKKHANQLDNGVKDDKPLLILSAGDFSRGSSQKYIGLGISSMREFSPSSGKNPVFASSLSVKPETNTSIAEAELSNAIPPLKLPPGRSASQPPAPVAPPLPPPAAPPPPPPKAACPPPFPPKTMPGRTKLSSSMPHSRRTSASSDGKNDDEDESASQKAKLKPFFWDKVLTNPDQSMVWHDISSGSFQFSEEMIESLFSYANVNNKKINCRKDPSALDPSIQYIQIIDPKKAQNLSILLRALNVTTEDVVNALTQGNELPVELSETLLKMAPSTEEELKLKLFAGDLSQLGPAERFLKALVDIPFAFKRIDSLLFRSSLQEEISAIKDSFATLEIACKKLRNSRLFLKLLEAVLKTGNRMNDGTYRGSAQAFKLDTLLKLADVKGADGKTTLLHFVVQEIVRSEGVRAARTAKESPSINSEYSEDLVDEAADHYRQLGLQVVSGLSTELEDVKKASVIDPDSLKMTVSRLCNSHIKIREFLENEMQSLDEKSGLYDSLTSFVAQKEPDIMEILEEEKRIRSLVKSTGDYFHGNSGKDEGLRLFAIVRDFLFMLDKSCKEVRDGAITITTKRYRKTANETENRQLTEIHSRLFPAIAGRRLNESSSDDESSSP